MCSLKNKKAPGAHGFPADVQIGKGKGPVDAPSSYRPLCMLDTAGKLLKELVRRPLQTAIIAAGNLSGRQYGFRMGRFTDDALQKIVRAAKSTEKGNYYSRSVCLLAALDVKNAGFDGPT